MIGRSLTDDDTCFDSWCPKVVVVAELGEELLVGVIGLVAPPFATCNLLLTSQEADMDPDMASETYVRSHQRLDRYKVQTLKYSKLIHIC